MVTDPHLGLTEGLRNFATQYNIAINDPDLIRRYRMVEDGKRDVATKIAVAEKNAHAEDARKMKADGMSSDLISKYTGLSIADIENL